MRETMVAPLHKEDVDDDGVEQNSLMKWMNDKIYRNLNSNPTTTGNISIQSLYYIYVF